MRTTFSRPASERFRLRELIGEGGAGLVVRADDQLSERPVAIKFIRGGDRTEWQIQALLREMRMVARLSHPAIVELIDAGHHNDVIHAEDGTTLPPGPWLAMELATGSLQRQPPRSGTELLAVVSSLLDALGHAHARGILHLDVKPTNLLLNAQRQLRLADFGLGLVSGAETISGATDGWSAPEVLACEVSLVGPWSDLHSVGRLLEAWLPVVSGGSPLSDQLAQVLDTLLHASPAARFRSVPAARMALLPALERYVTAMSRANAGPDPAVQAGQAPPPQASGRDAPGSEGPTPPPSSSRTLPVTRPVSAPEQRPSPARFEEQPSSIPLACTPAALAALPPGSSRADALPEHEAPPGLGLAGLRAGRLVGRRAERATLARASDAILSGERHAMLVVHGPAGVGLTQLATWTAERVLEQTGGTLLRLGGSGLDAVTLADALRTHLRLGDAATPQEVRARVDLALSRINVDSRFTRSTLAGWLAGGPPGAVTLRQLVDAVDELITGLAADGPVVLIVDPFDADFPETELLALLHQRLEATPCLLILVCTTGEETPSALAHLASLADVQHESLAVPALPPGDLARVIRARIAADDSLIHELVRVSSGRPRDAMLLIEHLVREKALVPAPGGYRPVGGLERHLPSSLTHLETRRLLGRVSALDDAARQELLLRALLDAAPPAVLRTALSRASLGDAAPALFELGLLHEHDGGPRVSSRALRRRLLELDALQDDLRLMLSWAIDAVAQADVQSGMMHPASRHELMAHLLERAGHLRAAVVSLLEAAWLWTTLAAPAWAMRLLEEADRLLNALDASAVDPLWNEACGVRAMALHQSGRSADGLAELTADREGVGRFSALARASCLLALGRPDEAVNVAWKLVDSAADGDVPERLEGLLLLGRCLIVAGQFPDSLPVLADVAAMARAVGDAETEDRAVAFTCHALAAMDAYDRCREVGEAALEQARADNRLWAIAQLSQPLGDIAFRQGRHQDALDLYMTGLEVLPYRSPIAAVTWANIARVHNELGDYRAADDAARNGLRHLHSESHNRVMHLVLSARLPWLVTSGNGEELEAVLNRLLAFAVGSQSTFREVAEHAEMGWQLSLASGLAEERLRELAAATWERLGEAERGERLRSGSVRS